MKKYALLFGAAAALSLAACGTSHDAGNAQADNALADNAALGDVTLNGETPAVDGNLADAPLVGNEGIADANTIGPVDNAH